MRSYTNIEQSKKLAEILPIESADAYYTVIDQGFFLEVKQGIEPSKDNIPCWSLAALLNILDFPALTQEDENEWEVCVLDYNNDEYIEIKADNPIDACYKMVLKLNELKMLQL